MFFSTVGLVVVKIVTKVQRLLLDAHQSLPQDNLLESHSLAIKLKKIKF
jgi:hypothetical protein